MRKYLRDLRYQQKLTQIQAAKKMRMSQSQYNALEKCHRQKDIRFSILLNISKAFHIPLQNVVEMEMQFLAKQKKKPP